MEVLDKLRPLGITSSRILAIQAGFSFICNWILDETVSWLISFHLWCNILLPCWICKVNGILGCISKSLKSCISIIWVQVGSIWFVNQVGELHSATRNWLFLLHRVENVFGGHCILVYQLTKLLMILTDDWLLLCQERIWLELWRQILECCTASWSHVVKSLAELTDCISIVRFLLIENLDTGWCILCWLLSFLQFWQETWSSLCCQADCCAEVCALTLSGLLRLAFQMWHGIRPWMLGIRLHLRMPPWEFINHVSCFCVSFTLRPLAFFKVLHCTSSQLLQLSDRPNVNIQVI